MKLNLKDLYRAFEQAEEGVTTPIDGVNTYLLEKVLRPTLQGKAPRLQEIDYSKFEDDDISDLADYCERLGRSVVKLEQFTGAVAAIEAIPSHSRQFC